MQVVCIIFSGKGADYAAFGFVLINVYSVQCDGGRRVFSIRLVDSNYSELLIISVIAKCRWYFYFSALSRLVIQLRLYFQHIHFDCKQFVIIGAVIIWKIKRINFFIALVGHRKDSNLSSNWVIILNFIATQVNFWRIVWMQFNWKGLVVLQPVSVLHLNENAVGTLTFIQTLLYFQQVSVDFKVRIVSVTLAFD